MSSANDIFTALRAMIIDSVDPLVYPANTIKYGYQVPLQGNFISYWIIQSNKTSVLGVDSYNDTDETRTNLLLYENYVQVDFYSDSPFASSDAADAFNQYLTSFGPEFLRYNYTDISLGIVEEGRNLTEPGDKATYLNRYTNRFTMFTHGEITRNQPFFDVIDIIPVLID